MIDWPDIKKYAFIIIAAIVAVALYYFFIYQSPEAQYQTFNFVSGSVVGKDDSGKTITVMASEGQFIPTGIRKTFFIVENTIIQKILPADGNKSGPETVFKKATFGDIKIGDNVMIQGEFTTKAQEEKTASAVSILDSGLLANRIDKSISTGLPKVLLPTLSGTVKEKNADSFVIEQTDVVTTEEGEAQTRPMTIKIDGNTIFRKTFVSQNTIKSIENSSFNDIKIGSSVVVELKENSDINAKEAVSQSVNIMNIASAN